MRILVVDDEYYARKALLQTIRDWDPEAALDEAEDGEEALGKLRAQPYELLFSDIRMPKLDGLQLAAAVHSEFPSVFNVIISGYDDFQYAQKAIVYQVKDYLLKPADKTAIWSILEKTRACTEQAEQEAIRQRLGDLLYTENADGIHAADLPPLACYRTVIAQADDLQEARLVRFLQEIFGAKAAPVYAFRDRRYPDRIVAVWAGETPSADASPGWPAKCQAAFRELAGETGGPVFIGISAAHSAPEELCASYREAKSAVLYKFFGEDGRGIFIFEEVSRNKRYNYELLDELLPPLYNKLIRGQQDEAAAIVDRLLSAAIESGMSVHALASTCSKIIAAFNSVIEHINENHSESVPYLEPADLHQFRDARELRTYFDRKLVLLGERIASFRKKEDVIELIKDYVERNYRYNIMLDDLAKNMFYTDASYLSRLFKKKNGTSFSQFLLSVRMRNAKKLLETSTALTVAEVANAVGFNDYSYFIQMYKKFYGETPGQSKKREQS